MLSPGTTVNSSPLPHRLCQVNPRDGDTCPTRGRLPSPSPTSRIFGATSRYSSSWVAFGEMNDLSPFRAPSTSWFLALLLLFPPGQTSKTSRWLPRLAGRLPVDAHISPFLFFLRHPRFPLTEPLFLENVPVSPATKSSRENLRRCSPIPRTMASVCARLCETRARGFCSNAE